MSGDAASAKDTPLLEARDISASYGHVQALKPTSLHISEGELVTILGPNGAGKTTLMRALTRLTVRKGTIFFRGEDVSGLSTHKLAQRGIVMVQEGRGLFPLMSVRENLVIGGYLHAGESDKQMESVFELFPRLRERLGQIAGSLSGGTADAGDRPCPHGQAETPHARRAVTGSRAAGGIGDSRHP